MCSVKKQGSKTGYKLRPNSKVCAFPNKWLLGCQTFDIMVKYAVFFEIYLSFKVRLTSEIRVNVSWGGGMKWNMQYSRCIMEKLGSSDWPKEKLNENHLQSQHLQLSLASSDLSKTKQNVRGWSYLTSLPLSYKHNRTFSPESATNVRWGSSRKILGFWTIITTLS